MAVDGGVLVERAHELAVLGEALDAAVAGHGSLVLVEGAAGAGVSSVLRAAVEGARTRSMAMGEARAAPAADAPALDVARQLLGQTIGDAEAFVAEARRLAETTPGLLLAIDDVQWADPLSLRALLALKPWLAQLRLVVVVGVHPGDRRVPVPVAHLLDALEARRLSPAPLSRAGISELAADRLGEAVSSRFAAACHELTGGNPWLATAALDALTARDLAPTADNLARLLDDVPEPLRRRVERVLAEVSAVAGALAAALAVLAEPVTVTRAAAVAELDADVVGAAADELAAAGLIRAGEPLAFREPLQAAAVAAGMPAFARTRAHRLALRELRRDDPSAERLGRHLLHLPGAADAADVATLRAAAQTAAAQDDRSGAVALLRRALAEPPAPDVELDVLTELALAEEAAGDAGAAERLRAVLARIGDVDTRKRLQAALGRSLLARGDYPEAGAVAEAALEELAPTDPEAEQLLVVELIACSVDPSLHAPATARVQPFTTSALAGDIPEDPGLCAWLAASLSAGGAPIATARSLVDHALSHNPLVDESHPSIFSFVRAALLNIDDVERAEETATAAMSQARERGLRVAHELAQHGRALARFRAGRLDEALDDALASLPRDDASWTLHARYAAALLVSVYVERGEDTAAREALTIATDQPSNGALEQAYVLHAQARLELLEGDPAAALATLLATREALRSFSLEGLSPTCLPWASTAAVAAAAIGEFVQAQELAADELSRARATRLPGTMGIALRGAALAEHGVRRLELLAEAVDELERSPLRLEHAYALLDLGAAMREDGRRVAAREPLAQALHLADWCGATVLAERGREQLRLAGARPRRAALTGVAALTSGERRVAELAAGGKTNSEIAEAQFVSIKTVEGTLARVYRKLEIASRKQLPDALTGGTRDATSPVP